MLFMYFIIIDNQHLQQVKPAIAKYFSLNETIAEAIALAHDVGHTPFGHVGERTLNQVNNARIVTLIESGFLFSCLFV